MRNSKIIFYLIFLSFLILGCKKKDKTPKEYFSFDAYGVHYDYPQDQTPRGLFGGGVSTLGAGSAGFGLGYQIYAFSLKNTTSPGTITFNFAENHIPTEDTIILDGVSNRTTVEWFLNQDAFYKLIPPQTGKIIFTERSNQKLTGFFEFDATLTTTPITGVVDTILHIINGKFSIIPSP